MQLLSIIILLTLTVVIHSLWMFGVLKFIKLEVDSAVRIVLRNVGIVISMIFAHLLEAGPLSLAIGQPNWRSLLSR